MLVDELRAGSRRHLRARSTAAGLALFAAVTSLTAASAHATGTTGHEGRPISAVEITCGDGQMKMELSQDQPANKLRVTTIKPASCTSTTHPEVKQAKTSGAGDFSGDCSQLNGKFDGTIDFLNSSGQRLYRSDISADFTVAKTANDGVTATVALVDFEGNPISGTGAGSGTSAAGAGVGCLTGPDDMNVTLTFGGGVAG